MLTRLFSRGLQLSIGSQRLEAGSAAEFDAMLRARTGLSSARIAVLGRLDDSGLSREQARLELLQERVAETLAAVAGGNGDAFLASSEIAELPDDQEWRDILAGLQRLGTEATAYRVAALRRFDEYLATGQDLLQSLRGAREPRPSQLVGNDIDDGVAGPRQKLLFDIDALPGEEASREELARVPKGETIQLPMRPHQSLGLVLARYRFLLVSGSPTLLVDDSGHDVKLPPGKVVVGRSSEADVALDAGYRAVSRRHLIIENGPDGMLSLTDISSLGTYLPKEYLGKILH